MIIARIVAGFALLATCSAALAAGTVADTAQDYGVATVEAVLAETREETGGFEHLTQSLRMRHADGTVFEMENAVLGGNADLRLSPGQQVVVERAGMPDGTVEYRMRERYRLPALQWLLAAFVLLGVLFGGVTGFMSIVGLLASVAVLMLFVVPRIAEGADPLLVSLTGAYVIACTSLFLAHGFKKRTSVALLSTCVTLAIAAAAAVFSVKFAALFGLGSEEAMFLQTGPLAGVNLRGLLIGGFIIGALGVLDDVTTAQTAAIDEISKANPSLTSRQLYKAGFSVGKEHIASLINTLALAYVGASLPLLLLFRQSTDVPAWMVVNGESIAEEIVRTLVGSTALLLAVPISTWFAAYLLKNRTGRVLRGNPHGHHHHHH